MVEVKALIVHLCDFYLREGSYVMVSVDIFEQRTCHHVVRHLKQLRESFSFA